MFGLNSLQDRWAINRINRIYSAFNVNTGGVMAGGYQFMSDKPSWISLSCPEDFEKAVRFNPVVKSVINLLATSASNGRKVAVDIKTGEVIPWTDKDKAIQKAYQLLIQRPNPMQSAKEFYFHHIFYLKTFGNGYIYASMPVGFDKEIDLMNIEVLNNLPSQFMQVKTTGKIYDQTTISGIISEYARTNVNPVEKYNPEHILHFNEVNVSSELPTVMGISKIESLQMPITNTQLAFEAMNVILKHRGQQGIIQGKKKDGMNSAVPWTPEEKKEVQEAHKQDYGLLNHQNPFMISPVPLEYVKTVMNSKELGIYEEFSNNAILISNEFGVPPELVKTYIQGATYENQIQSVKRLYQDTTIPMVDDQDSYWTYRLNTEKYGFRLETKWDHIPALSSNKKEVATAVNLKGRTADSAYKENIITRNQYLEMIEQPAVKDGDIYKFEWDKKTGDGENKE